VLLTSGVVDTGGKCNAGVFDTHGNVPLASLSFEVGWLNSIADFFYKHLGLSKEIDNIRQILVF
jgi:hypothetical protein